MGTCSRPQNSHAIGGRPSSGHMNCGAIPEAREVLQAACIWQRPARIEVIQLAFCLIVAQCLTSQHEQNSQQQSLIQVNMQRWSHRLSPCAFFHLLPRKVLGAHQHWQARQSCAPITAEHYSKAPGQTAAHGTALCSRSGSRWSQPPSRPPAPA